MNIEDPEIVELVKQIEELERKLYAHPLHKVYIMILTFLLSLSTGIKFSFMCFIHCPINYHSHVKWTRWNVFRGKQRLIMKFKYSRTKCVILRYAWGIFNISWLKILLSCFLSILEVLVIVCLTWGLTSYCLDASQLGCSFMLCLSHINFV